MVSLPQVSDEPLPAALRGTLRGQVRFSPHDRALYATDASLYQATPLGVIVPADVDDLIAAVGVLTQHRVPMLARGGGTSLAGQCTAEGAVVLDTSAALRGIGTPDIPARTVRVEPGVVLDDLNRAIRPSGLFFAPDPATAAQATVGGCIGNNAAGSRSIKYGRTSESVRSLEVLLSSGERCTLGAGVDSAVARRLSRQVAGIVRRHAGAIRARFPKTVRRNAGYALDAMMAQLDAGVADDWLNLAPLICGSEGTLAIVLSAELALHPIPPRRALIVACFPSVDAAIAAVGPAITTGPSAVELLDDVVLTCAAENAEYRRSLDLFATDGNLPQALLYIEYELPEAGMDLEPAVARLRELLSGAVLKPYAEPAAVNEAWALRKAAEPLLHALPGARKPHTFVEDNAVPPERLAEFVAGFKAIVARHGTTAAYYAHASVGLLHVRPLVDLHDPADLARMRAIAVEVADLARACGGVMSGEHGDGKVRGPLLERFYGPEIMGAFREIKAIFDPANLLNPGNITAPGPIESITSGLRIEACGPGLGGVDTHYTYEAQDGLAHAIESCNGAGVCRRSAVGAMCPSYRGTRDERHSPRGRANALRASLLGGGQPDFTDEETRRTLDLCLGCKACKTECPSNVDIAKYKAEYMAQRYARTGTPLAARVTAHIRTLNRLGGISPRVANALSRLWPMRALANRLLHLAPRRRLPRFARPAQWPSPARDGRPTVLLFADCFNTYTEPNVLHAARAVLDAFGYAVELANVGCCGRAAISSGVLEAGARMTEESAAALAHRLEGGGVRAVLFLEPSCASAVRDDALELRMGLPPERRRAVARASWLVEEFLERDWDRHPRRPAFATNGAGMLLHIHCHQRALWGEGSGAGLLRRLAPATTLTTPTCCGMAGAFGYQADHHDLSVSIAELSLAPEARAAAAAGQTVCAGGTSCREQIRHVAGVPAIHPLEFLAARLQDDD